MIAPNREPVEATAPRAEWVWTGEPRRDADETEGCGAGWDLRALLVEGPAVDRRHGQGLVDAVAIDHHGHRCVGMVADGLDQGGLVAADGPAVDRLHDVAGPDAADLGRTGQAAHGIESLDLHLIRVGHPDEDEQDPQQDEGQQEVHGRTGHGHTQPGVEGLVPVESSLVGRVHLLEIGHPGDLDVATEGKCLDAVLGLAPPERPQAGSEPDEVLGDLHAAPLGHGEVTELVEHDDHDDGDDHDQQVHVAGDHGQGDDGHQGDDELGGQPPRGLRRSGGRSIGAARIGDRTDGGLEVDGAHDADSRCETIDPASRRAVASASRTSSTVRSPGAPATR